MNKKAQTISQLGYILIAIVFLLIMIAVILHIKHMDIEWLNKIKDLIR